MQVLGRFLADDRVRGVEGLGDYFASLHHDIRETGSHRERIKWAEILDRITTKIDLLSGVQGEDVDGMDVAAELMNSLYEALDSDDALLAGVEAQIRQIKRLKGKGGAG